MIDHDDERFGAPVPTYRNRFASVPTFVRLLREGPQTYADLMEATGVCLRTAKARLRKIRNLYRVRTFRRREGYKHKGWLVMHIVDEPKASVQFTLATRLPSTVLPRNQRVIDLAVEMLISSSWDLDLRSADEVDDLVVSVADFIRWLPDELALSIERIHGMPPAPLISSFRTCVARFQKNHSYI